MKKKLNIFSLNEQIKSMPDKFPKGDNKQIRAQCVYMLLK